LTGLPAPGSGRGPCSPGAGWSSPSTARPSAARKRSRGTALHAAAERGVTLKSIADQIGHQLGVPSVSMTFEEASAHFEDASEHFGITFLATMLATGVPVSSDLTRALLGWEPTHESLLEDLRFGDYITGPLSQP
jgi:hypothetical protein